MSGISEAVKLVPAVTKPFESYVIFVCVPAVIAVFGCNAVAPASAPERIVDKSEIASYLVFQVVLFAAVTNLFVEDESSTKSALSLFVDVIKV